MASAKHTVKQPSRKCNRREQQTNLTVSFVQSGSVFDESLDCADVAIKVRAHSTRLSCVWCISSYLYHTSCSNQSSSKA